MKIYTTLVLAATAAYANGQQALHLNNVTVDPHGYVRVADSPGIEPTHLTLEAWITPQGIGTGANDSFGTVIAGKALEGMTGPYLLPYGLAWSPLTGRVLGYVRTGPGQGGQVTSLRTVGIGTTVHVAMTYDGTLLQVFVDGMLEGCTPASGAIDYGDEDLLFGAANFGSGYVRRYDGLIDEVRLWDRALSAGEIAERAGCPLMGSEPGLRGYWNFDNGDLVDATGNGHDGVAEGTEWSFALELTPDAPCGADVGTRYCSPAVDNSSGAPGTISAIGSDVLADDQLTLVVENLPSGQFGYFLTGMTQGSFSPPASSGVVCLSGNIGRFNQVVNIGMGPCFSMEVDLSSFPVNPPRPPVAGETWHFQCWYRDGATNNFTDAVSVTFQ